MQTIKRLEGDNKKRMEIISEVYNNLAMPIYRAVAMSDPSYREISYTRKSSEGKKNTGDEYGYFIMRDISYLIEILNHYKCKSLCDLGCGAAILLAGLKLYFKGSVRFNGFDNESKLITMAKQVMTCEGAFKVADIITLKAEDIHNHDIIYFWEPFTDRKLSRKFVDNLSTIIHKNQIIIYKQSGPIREFMPHYFDRIAGHGDLQVYKLKEHLWK